MSFYDTARKCHEEREMGPCTPRWTGERTGQLSGAGMMFGIRLCIGQVLGVSLGNIASATVKRPGPRLQVCATVNTSVVGLNIMNFVNARYIMV
jgi:hypothetical protein